MWKIGIVKAETVAAGAGAAPFGGAGFLENADAIWIIGP
jgi:hypothetical protein